MTKGGVPMIETYENKMLKTCLRCNKEVTDPREDYIYCTKCASPLQNRCTNHQDFHDGNFYGEECGEILEPDAAFCPKCAAESLFNKAGIIDVEYPRTEIIQPFNPEDPF